MCFSDFVITKFSPCLVQIFGLSRLVKKKKKKASSGVKAPFRSKGSDQTAVLRSQSGPN